MWTSTAALPNLDTSAACAWLNVTCWGVYAKESGTKGVSLQHCKKYHVRVRCNIAPGDDVSRLKDEKETYLGRVLQVAEY